jgi:hypothetical protein
MKYKEIICERCGNPILKDDKTIILDDNKVIHDYCKFKE